MRDCKGWHETEGGKEHKKLTVGVRECKTQERKIVCLEEHAREGEKSRVTQREGGVQEREDAHKSEGTQEIYGKQGVERGGGEQSTSRREGIHIQERGHEHPRQLERAYDREGNIQEDRKS